jgi:polysaccharide biosynthesis transport protein
MNSGPQTNTVNGQPAANGKNLDDVLYTLFRHKWLIAGFVCLGVLAVCVVRVARPPFYTSHAKLMIHYIEERPPAPTSQDSQIHNPESSGLGLLNTEKELIKSLDVATNVAAAVGPRRLLGGKGDDLMGAAGVVCDGLDVEVPATTPILLITFKHRDKTLSQKVVGAVVQAYTKKHQEVHGSGAMDDFNRQQRDALRAELTQTEEDLRKIMTNASLLSIEQTKQNYQAQIAKWEQELHSVEVELDSRKAVLGDAMKASMAAGNTNAGPLPPAEKIRAYGELARQAEHLKRVKEDLLLQYKEAYPSVGATTAQLERVNIQKAQLEKEYPSLAHIELGSSSTGTNSTAGELADIQRLSARMASIKTVLAELNAGASHVLELEPVIAALQRQRSLQETNYYRYSESLDRQKIAQELSGGKAINIGTIEQPTPPMLDNKKLMKLLGAAFGGCVAMGLGLAFLIDFFIDRTLRRPIEVQRHLKNPVFLTIPDLSWAGPNQLPGFRPKLTNGANGHANGGVSHAVDRYQPQVALAEHTAGLRERVVTYFEINGLNQKRPKLVGVTGCHEGAGVSVLASGLALSLSEAGGGNVLLVDLNRGDGVAKAFRHGQPATDISDALHSEPQMDAKPVDPSYEPAAGKENNGSLAVGFPARLVPLVPDVNASSYDYIVFDMPPVSPTTPTPRLSGHMDLVLMVLESGKTGQQPAIRANALLKESHAKVATILNKYRSYVPNQISQEI